MRLATSSEIFEIDRRCEAEHDLPSRVLMENAGRAIVAEILRLKWNRRAPAWVFCGPGKNGGDGEVIARELRSAGIEIHLWKEGDEVPPAAALSGLVVDALFGIGLSREIGGSFRQALETVNRSKAFVVAVDVPSGLDADRGTVRGIAVRARVTLTCGLAKPGFFLNDGPAHVGCMKVVPVGYPPGLVKDVAASTFFIGARSAGRLVPARRASANKTNFGRVLVVGGAEGMEGAALLAAEACARSGAGYVTLCSPTNIPFGARRPDFLSLDWKALKSVDLSHFDAIVVGPGLGVGAEQRQALEILIDSRRPLVIDADALTIIASSEVRLHEHSVITPHAGEMSRLIQRTAREIESDRLAAARAAASLGAVVLLKGYRTVVFDGARSFIVGSGNSALAKAGTGDVLSGFIAAWIAQGLDVPRASVLAAFIHGFIADEWLRSGRGARTLMASDLPELVGAALGKISGR